MGTFMIKSEALEVTELLIDIEKENPHSMYNGEGRSWIMWFIILLYKSGFIITQKGES